MNRFRKKYKQIGDRKIKTFRKKDIIKLFYLFKNSLLKTENMIKKYRIKLGFRKKVKYFFIAIVTTIDGTVIEYKIDTKWRRK